AMSIRLRSQPGTEDLQSKYQEYYDRHLATVHFNPKVLKEELKALENSAGHSARSKMASLQDRAEDAKKLKDASVGEWKQELKQSTRNWMRRAKEKEQGCRTRIRAYQAVSKSVEAVALAYKKLLGAENP